MPIDINPSPSSKSSKDKPDSTRAAKRSLNFDIQLGPSKIGIEQRMVFTEQLTLLLQTGVSLLEALKAIQLQTEDPVIAEIISSVAETISNGESFSHALSMHPKMFNNTYTSLVAAAETGGFLAEVLEQLLAMDEKNNQLRNDIISALSYPAFLIAFSVAVVVFVLIVIFPKFEDLFASIHDQLPITTILLMSLSAFVRQYWIILLAACMLTGWGSVIWAGSKAGKHILDKLKMTIPVVKDIYIKIYLSQTLSVLGLSLSNGVPITAALKACQNVVTNHIFVDFLSSVREQVNEGRGIAPGFNDSPFVPPMVRQMINTGEQTGNLGLVMSRIALFYERDISKRIAVLSKSIEPIMLVVMGVVVGVIVVSLILPIFKLSRAVH